MIFDTIILGSSITGSTLASILGRHGYRVLLLDRGRHPRFALGEAMVAQTSFWLWLLSERYGVPEIKLLSNTRSVAQAVSRSCGIKRSVGFVHHHEGRVHDPDESTQIVAPEVPFTSESHLYRQDIDRYMVDVARRYGAELREGAQVSHLTCDDRGCWVSLASGEEFRGRYLVDATNIQSVAARQLGLREEPTHLRTQSRSIFTHVEGLRPFDELVPPAQLPRSRYHWHQGTLHHVFDGGWFWIIPFDNRVGSDNPRASIGLTLDMRKYPRHEVPPEQEFRQVVQRFPTIAAHLERCRPVMDWVGTGRLQYSSRAAVGQRFYISAQAYGAIDALYSRGMVNTFESLYAFAHRLIAALRDDDFSPQRFARMNQLQRDQLDAHDQMVSIAYDALAHYATWSAWLKVWISTKLFGDIWLLRSILKYLASGDRRILEALDDIPTPPHDGVMRANVDFADAQIQAACQGRMSYQEAADRIFARLRDSDWLPHHTYKWGLPGVRHNDFSRPDKLPLAVAWGKTLAPAWVRRDLFDFPVSPLLKAKAIDALSRAH